jgi:hypothetical protein
VGAKKKNRPNAPKTTAGDYDDAHLETLSYPSGSSSSSSLVLHSFWQVQDLEELEKTCRVGHR